MNTKLTVILSERDMFNNYSLDEKNEFYHEAEVKTLKRASVRAAEEISELLFDGKNHIIGLNWGYTVRKVVENLSPLPTEVKDASIKVVSLFGDLGFVISENTKNLAKLSDLNSNMNVDVMIRKLGGKGEAIPLNVPGFIPSELTEHVGMLKDIKDFLTKHVSYRRIFGKNYGMDSQKPTPRPEDSLIASMDTIITSFGAADAYTRFDRYLRILLNKKEQRVLDEFKESGKIVGDIGGHFVPSFEGEGEVEVINFIDKVNQRIIAAQPNDFIDVASRYRKNGFGAGVVGIAIGARKAKILYSLLSQAPCSISRLIIDSHCGLALLYLIDPDEFWRFTENEGKGFIRNFDDWSKDTKKVIPCK